MTQENNSIKHIIWDLSGTIVKATTKKIPVKKRTDAALFFYLWGATKKQSTLVKQALAILHQIKVPSYKNYAHVLLSNGQLVPPIVSAWLAGKYSSTEIITKAIQYSNSLLDHKLISKQNQIKIKRLFSTGFDPYIIAKSMSVIRQSLKLIKACSHAKRTNLYILSNWDKESFDLLCTLPYAQNILKYFNSDNIAISGQLGLLKPNTTMYSFLLNTYKLRPEECLFIDDQQENLDSAQKLGIHGYHYNQLKAHLLYAELQRHRIIP